MNLHQDNTHTDQNIKVKVHIPLESQQEWDFKGHLQNYFVKKLVQTEIDKLKYLGVIQNRNQLAEDT